MTEKFNNWNEQGLQYYINLQKYGLTTFTLKIIAVITMLIDHIGVLFLQGHTYYAALPFSGGMRNVVIPYYTIFRAIGRISFPIFAFLIVEGFFHTSNRKKYAARLAVFAVISEVPYDIAFQGTWFDPGRQNIFFTLLIGLLAVWALYHISGGQVRGTAGQKGMTGAFPYQFVIRIIIMIVACGAGYLVQCTYSYAGIFLILCFYVFYGQHIGKAAANAFFNIMMFGGIQSFGTLSVIPIAFYNGEKGKKKWKWFFYLFYPVHLVILSAIAYIF